MVEWDKADCVLSAFFKEKQTYSNIASWPWFFSNPKILLFFEKHTRLWYWDVL
jgi:hypothetical protein